MVYLVLTRTYHFQTPNGPCRREQIYAIMKTNHPSLTNPALFDLWLGSVDRCYFYITNTLIGQCNYTVDKANLYLLTKASPFPFCHETVESAIFRVRTEANQQISVMTPHQPLLYTLTPSTSQPYTLSPLSGSSHFVGANYAPKPSGTQSYSLLPSLTASTAPISELNFGINNMAPFAPIEGPPLAKSVSSGISVAGPSWTGFGNLTPVLQAPSIGGPPIQGPKISPPPIASPSSSSSSPTSTNSFQPSDKPSSPAAATVRSPGTALLAGKVCSKEKLEHYCRQWNLKYLGSCADLHLYHSGIHRLVSQKEDHKLTELQPKQGAFEGVACDFMASWKMPGPKPTITKIESISCPKLEEYFTATESMLFKKGSPTIHRPLYHGTCEANFATLFENGLQPPSDYEPNANCPNCGHLAGKIFSSICMRNCTDCAGDKAVRHTWRQCHMYGLGIYFADQSSKSDRYVSDKTGGKPKTGRKMLVVQVMLGDCHEVETLKKADEYHDFIAPPDGKDSIMAIGKPKPVSGLEVLNNECASFLQLLPFFPVST